MLFNNQQTLKFLVIIPTVLVLLFGFLCTGMFHVNTNSVMDMDGITDQSIRMDHCCNSAMSKRVESWKNIFLVSIQLVLANSTLLLLGMILFIFFSYTIRRYFFSNHQLFPNYRFHIRNNTDVFLSDHLNLMFARGILNPKIY